MTYMARFGFMARFRSLSGQFWISDKNYHFSTFFWPNPIEIRRATTLDDLPKCPRALLLGFLDITGL